MGGMIFLDKIVWVHFHSKGIISLPIITAIINKTYSYLSFSPYLLISRIRERMVVNIVTVIIDVKIAEKDIIIVYFSRLFIRV